MLNLFIPFGGCILEGCCWYTFFNWMGCFEGDREEIKTQPPPVRSEPNPFIHTGMPKDAHMLPAYR